MKMRLTPARRASAPNGGSGFDLLAEVRPGTTQFDLGGLKDELETLPGIPATSPPRLAFCSHLNNNADEFVPYA